jgi:hypothetical protein
MTEAEWLAHKDPEQMVRVFVGNGGSDRRFLLFACACFDEFASAAWDIDPPSEVLRIVEVARRFADGNATKQERITALRSAKRGANASEYQSLASVAWWAAKYTVDKLPWWAAVSAATIPTTSTTLCLPENGKRPLPVRMKPLWP